MKRNSLLRSLKIAGLLIVTAVLFTNCGQTGFQSVIPQDTGGGASTGTDAFYSYAWHLSNTGQKVFADNGGVAGNDVNVESVWSSGLKGQGLKILVSDDGVEDTHEDLNANFSYTMESRDYTISSPYLATKSAPKMDSDNHGTMVAGLIAAIGWNGRGSRGVAPEASIISANFLSGAVTQTSARMIDQADGDFDISNMSWGYTQNFVDVPDLDYEDQLLYAVTNKRGGKGSVFVKASGNDYFVACQGTTSTPCIGSANFDFLNTNPYTIVVGSINAEALSASYSSAGSNLWISAPGGEPGTDTPGIFSTDRTGCDKGYAASTSSSAMVFERGQKSNSSCKYSLSFAGTSAAAPVVSGGIALILEANPNLTWRDVKYILAKTADKIDLQTGSIGNPLESTPAGYVWEQRWITNAQGFNFHNWYGFGRMDVAAAVQMAKTYSVNLGTYMQTNWANNNAGLSIAIPDNSATGATNTMNVASTLKIESVQLKLWVTHADISELAVELTSPSGTKSILVNMRNSLTGISNYQGEVFLSNAFYQESATGTWTIKVVDGKAANTGTLTRWSLNITGGP